MISGRSPRIPLLATALLAVAHPQLTHAAAQDHTVLFTSLPSAQGWTYATSVVAAPETPTWSLSGGVLSYNTMAYATNTSGTGTSSFYRMSGLVSGSEPIVLEMRGRILQHEHDGSTFRSGGFSFGLGNGATTWTMGIEPTSVRNVNNVVLVTNDNTVFHDYRLEWYPGPIVKYYVDNVLISTNSGGFSQAANQVFFGDGTGAANAQAEITHFRWRQGVGVPVELSRFTIE